MTGRQLRDPIPLVVKECVGPDDKRVGAQAGKLAKGSINLSFGAGIDYFYAHRAPSGRLPNFLFDLLCNRKLGVDEQPDDPSTGDQLGKQFQPLCNKLKRLEADTRDISLRAGKAFYDPALHGIRS